MTVIAECHRACIQQKKALRIGAKRQNHSLLSAGWAASSVPLSARGQPHANTRLHLSAGLKCRPAMPRSGSRVTGTVALAYPNFLRLLPLSRGVV